MPRLPLPVARALLAPTFRAILDPHIPFPAQRRIMEAVAAAQLSPRGSVVRRDALAGRPVEIHTNSRAPGRSGSLLYLHGGAYTVGSPATHRALAAHLAAYSDYTVYVLDYRLAPEHPFPAGLDDAVTAFAELARREPVAIAGDSAGGGLATATALRLRDAGGPMPVALGLIAPWVDPFREVDKDRDVVVNRGWAESSRAAYRGAGPDAPAVTDPYLAPLHADLSGLPPTLVQIGSDELLAPQVREFVGLLGTAGVPTEFHEDRDLWHVSQLQASLVREADESVRTIARFLDRALLPTI